MITMTPELFGGTDYDGIRVENVGDDGDHYAALGHIDKAAFAAAALRQCRYEVGSDDFDADEFVAENVVHTWWVLTDPSTWDGDEWCATWAGVDESTPGAFSVTVIDLS